jgi:glucose dehydrogenase
VRGRLIVRQVQPSNGAEAFLLCLFATLEAPYGMHRDWLVSPSGLPCNAPSWGALMTFDLSTGNMRWEAPIGAPGPGAPAGSPGFCGPMDTASCPIFTAAAMDPYLHAVDADAGEEIQNDGLPLSSIREKE